MTTTELAQLTATITNLSTAQLIAMVDEARANMLTAWRAQSACTVDDGNTFEQARAATFQAQDSQSVYYMLHAQLEARLVEEAQLDTPDYHMTEDGLMGGDYESEIIF